MKLLRISDDLVINPSAISHYSVVGPIAETGVPMLFVVMAHSFSGHFPLASFDGYWQDEPEKDNRWGTEVARERAQRELARIQALVEEL